MGKFIERKPWLFLDEYKGKIFNGEWPTFPELLKIQVQRFAERPLFTDFEGPNGSKNTLTYNQVYQKVIKLCYKRKKFSRVGSKLSCKLLCGSNCGSD